MAQAHVVVDYQNVHLTGHGKWCPEGDPAHLCLLHPLQLAQQLVRQRNLIKGLFAEKNGLDFEAVTLASVRSFRGQPSNKHDTKNYRRTQAQQSHWTRDPRSTVVYLPLKYYEYSPGRFDIKEKGIDVLVALELVTRAAQATPDDVVILFASDTDQEPALELACQLAGKRIETATWHGERRLKASNCATWHTQLDEQHFIAARDLRDYT